MDVQRTLLVREAMSRVSVLTPLRGVASFAVLWFHFTQGNPDFLPNGLIKSSGHYGWLGVEMFFVISGFVIPWSLYNSQYSLRRDWKRFVAKRIIRLDPPYLCSIAFIVALNWAFHDQTVTAPQLLAHLGYANAVMRYEWVNPVYWTLAIEAMFYVAVAIGFPYLARIDKSPLVYLLILTLPFLVSDERWIIHYLPLFGMGIATFQFLIDRRQPWRYLGLLIALTTVGGLVMSWPMAFAGLGTAVVIASIPQWELRPLAWLGQISYSLYLLHLPIGGKIVNFGARYADSLLARLIVLAVAVAASLLGAWLLWRFVEMPAQRWSSAIRYGTREAGSPLDVIEHSPTAPVAASVS